MPSLRPPIDHVHVHSLAESWLAMLRCCDAAPALPALPFWQLCLFGICATHEEGERLAYFRCGKTKVCDIATATMEVRYLYKLWISQASNLKNSITSFRLRTQHQLQNHNPKPQTIFSPVSAFTHHHNGRPTKSQYLGLLPVRNGWNGVPNYSAMP